MIGKSCAWAGLVASLVATGGLVSHARDQATATADAIARAESAFAAALATSGTPGASIAVVLSDRVVWATGAGMASVETRAAVTPDTLFQIGSATKPFTAAALLAAEAQGRLALDRPVSTYVSGLAACVGAPTLRQLLSHTGGLMDEPDEFGPQGEEGLAAYPRTWTREYCLLPPGRAFSYSNSGFALAGLALQEVEQQPFAEVLRARVLTPLGMTRTTFRPTEAMTWPLAVGHRRGQGAAFTVVRPLANDARLWPAGTLYSSATELARFLIALLNDGRVDGAQALPTGLVSRMRADVAAIPTSGERYGQGLFLSAGAGHGGSMTGYVAQLDVRGRGGIVVLTNGDSAHVDPLVGVGRALLQELQPGASPTPTPAPSAAPARQLTEAQAHAYVGTYRNPRRFTVEVVRQGSGLVLKRFGRDFPMRAVDPDGHFLVDLPRGGTEAIVFGRDAQGRADYVQLNVWALARVAAP